MTYKLEGKTAKFKREEIEQLTKSTVNPETFIIENLSKKEEALRINFTFASEKNYTKLNNDHYITLKFSRIIPFERISSVERNNNDLESNYKNFYQQEIELEIPETYSIKHLPSNAQFGNDDFGFWITYEKKERKIFRHLNIYINQLIIKNKDFNKWNQLIDQLIQIDQQTLVLTQNP
jgi:hypothetical protein